MFSIPFPKLIIAFSPTKRYFVLNSVNSKCAVPIGGSLYKKIPF